jgi:two-component system, NtrC family, nitrogen regulation sensor histidine kinase GlnL
MRERFVAYDALATLVAVVGADGNVMYCNAALEGTLDVSRRLIENNSLADYFVDPVPYLNALVTVRSQSFATLRYDAQLRRHNTDTILVHVILVQGEQAGELLIEMLPQDKQAKQDREERMLEQALANKELIRNLAHEIKNPLGGIRGAAQLLEMELPGRELHEYTQVIIRESDRLQSLVDRLLAPHRNAKVVGDVNMHEVCERVRSLILAEFPRGLTVERDYDVSIPEFRGDKEQLIQAILNIAHNACQAMADRIAEGSAVLRMSSRIARQLTFGKQRYKLALELHVIDNGPGIPEEIKDKIFFPLVSAREGGSGLGLTLAQTFVGHHGGVIECDSEAGRTDFKILIPLP